MWMQLERTLHRTRTIELRLDWLATDHEISSFLRRLSRNRPHATLIATCRRLEASGKYRGTIAGQLIHLAEALRAGCSWYDFDLETASRCPAELTQLLLEGKRLASAHLFGKAPGDLNHVGARLRKFRANAIKIAAECHSLAEAVGVVRVASHKQDVVTIPMGEIAAPVRVLALRHGSALAYASVENPTAAGQISLGEMLGLYRANRLDRNTQVYGVIGDPVGHSLSPLLQNAGFRARRMNAVYLPFLVHDLSDFLQSIKFLRIAGFSVTLPHKERILRSLNDCDPLASEIGAVNTVVVRPGGRLYGYNTDYVGVLRTLERRVPLRGSRVLILGAGGAGRAVAFALGQAGSSVSIHSRTKKRAEALAKLTGADVIPRERIRREFFDAIVNATPVGMYPDRASSALKANELNCRLLFDTIYRPRVTRLMQLATRRGIETISGLEMFIAQGTAQWEIWTGQRAPVQAMSRVVERALDREENADVRSHSWNRREPR